MQSNQSMPATHIIALVLAGGAGSRLGGVDKGLQHYKGRPLIEYTLNALSAQVDTLILSVNRNFEFYQAYDLPLVNDLESEPCYQGPLAGVVAAWHQIHKSACDYLLLAPCDTPLLPSQYVAKLREHLTDPKTTVAVVHDGVRAQNLHCLIRVEALPSLTTFYQSGGRALHRWFAQQNVVMVDFADQAVCFSNMNTLDELTS